MDFLCDFLFDLLKTLYMSCDFAMFQQAAVPALAKMDMEDKPHAAFLQRSLEILQCQVNLFATLLYQYGCFISYSSFVSTWIFL